MARLQLIFAMIVIAALAASASTAQAAVSDPLFAFVPRNAGAFSALPPPFGVLEDPCGMGVGPDGHFYVSDYYHHVVDIYDQNATYTGAGVSGGTGYLGQYAGIDPEDGPCGLALDSAENLYVTDYHRAVIRYPGAVTITGATLDGTHPTGVAVNPANEHVYVDQRTYVGVFDSSGSPVMDGSAPMRIGQGPLRDGYGIAVSRYSGTEGRIYVPDAAANTVKVFDPAVDPTNPIEVIDGADTPQGGFVSLRDASIAIDRVSGEIYVVDDLQPEYAESPLAIVQVFASTGAYEGHLKFLLEDGSPSGLAVDNTAQPTQGRVYVTSGNSVFGAIFAYPPGAATTEPIGPAVAKLAPTVGGSGSGTVDEAADVHGAFSANAGTGSSPESGAPSTMAAPVLDAGAGKSRRRRCRHGHRAPKCKGRHHPRRADARGAGR